MLDELRRLRRLASRNLASRNALRRGLAVLQKEYDTLVDIEKDLARRCRDAKARRDHAAKTLCADHAALVEMLEDMRRELVFGA